ncbi:MAG: hypothetical protein ACTSRZ_10505 [Promethearchaeota archaeon]
MMEDNGDSLISIDILQKIQKINQQILNHKDVIKETPSLVKFVNSGNSDTSNDSKKLETDSKPDLSSNSDSKPLISAQSISDDEISMKKTENRDDSKDLKSENDDGKGSDDGKKEEGKGKKKKKEKKAKLQFPVYITLWVIYFYLGILLPLNLFFLYMLYIFIPKFIMIGYPHNWNTYWYIFKDPLGVINAFMKVLSDPTGLIVFLTSPLVFVGIYLFKLFCDATIMKFYMWMLNKVQPRRQMINAPPRGDTASDVMMYHTRNFLLRIIKWEFSKCPFPWLTIWMFNYIGTNKLGKGTTIEDGFICCEYLETGKNVYIGFGAITSSHLVEGIYGALTVKKVKLGNNVVIGSRSAVPPGTEMGDNSQVLWNSAILKFQKIKEGANYWGLPVSKLTKNRYKKFIKLPKEVEEKYKSSK